MQGVLIGGGGFPVMPGKLEPNTSARQSRGGAQASANVVHEKRVMNAPYGDLIFNLIHFQRFI
jgi:hypothetical protein